VKNPALKGEALTSGQDVQRNLRESKAKVNKSKDQNVNECKKYLENMLDILLFATRNWQIV